MPWYAKPYGGYSIDSVEGTENILMMNEFFNEKGYALEAQAGIIGNSTREGVLNPWRWEHDRVNTANGYGLFQFTPATTYFNRCSTFPDYSPNMSVTEQTTGATPEDGNAQLKAVDEDTLGKWLNYIWRNYWDRTQYAVFAQMVDDAIARWGTNGRVSWQQFKQVSNVQDAVVLFLGGYEGPRVPNWLERLNNANAILPLLKEGKRKGMPIWMYLRPFF